MTDPSKYAAPVLKEVQRKRRELGSQSPEMFGKIYLKANCSLPYSRMHNELFVELAKLIRQMGGRLAVAAPRDHAKSTIVSLVFALWCLLYEKEKLILIVSATKEQAIMHLGHIREQLQTNELLIQDFPEVCQPEEPASGRRRSKPWRENRFRLPNGAMACAYGTGQNLRGARNGEHRPGLIIADDLENQEQVISEEQRKKLSAWFNRTLIRAGHPDTNVIVIGTVLHPDSLLAGLIDPHDRRGWTGLRFQAVEQFSDRPDLWDQWVSIFRDLEEYEGKTGLEAAKAFYESDEAAMLEGTKVLWPEREDYHALMVMREREGRASFQAEKQNEPVDPELCVFADQDFHYWDDEYDDEQSLLKALGSNGYFYGACDPSLGKRMGQGDYTAIIILYHHERSEINYVIAADIARRRPAGTIERIIEYARLYDFENFAVEGNNFQELLVENLERAARAANVQLPIETVTNRSNKMSRIASLQPLVSQGRVRFCRRHHLLMDQLRQYPSGVHDDGPDALEMAVTVAREPRVTMYVNGVPLLDIWPPPIRGL